MKGQPDLVDRLQAEILSPGMQRFVDSPEAEARLEIIRLRKALAVFADKRNWMSYSPGYGRPAHTGWNGGGIPWLLAQEALGQQ